MLNSQELIEGWRGDESVASPAGPLFVSGPYAEADITGASNTISAGAMCTQGCGTNCTGSAGHTCC